MRTLSFIANRSKDVKVAWTQFDFDMIFRYSAIGLEFAVSHAYNGKMQFEYLSRSNCDFDKALNAG